MFIPPAARVIAEEAKANARVTDGRFGLPGQSGETLFHEVTFQTDVPAYDLVDVAIHSLESTDSTASNADSPMPVETQTTSPTGDDMQMMSTKIPFHGPLHGTRIWVLRGVPGVQARN